MIYELKTMGSRIRFVQEKVGGSYNLQNLTKISQSQLSRLIRDEVKNPGILQLISIAKAGGVQIAWLIEGGEGEGGNVSGKNNATGYISIPYYDDGSAPVMFERSYLINEMGATPDCCVMFKARDDSMKTSINKGDKLLIDTSRADGDGMFLIKIDGRLFVKRLQWLPGSGVDVVSDNPSYKAYQLDPDKLQVIGQVIWIGSQQ